MGAQQSIHAGKAKIEVNVDLTHQFCAVLMLSPSRSYGGPLSLVIGSLCVKLPNLFGRSEKFEVSCQKGLCNSNLLVAYRRPRPNWLAQQSLVIQHTVSPEIGVHGLLSDNLSHTDSGGVNLSKFSVGLDLDEHASSNWSSTTGIKFERICPLNDDGHSIIRDLDGFSVTCSGSPHDDMVILKQESRFAQANECSFTRFSLQIEQGVPVLPKWLVFNRFKFVASKGYRLGPSFLLTSLTGGSVVGDIAPYQALAIGGVGSIRGYSEGAVGCGTSCLTANSELTFPLSKMLEGAIFLDCGSDLGTGRHVPGNPCLRRGKPGSGFGIGFGLRFKSDFGHWELHFAVNAVRRRTAYFGISSMTV